MLHELAVRNLGVIEEAAVVLPSGLTALTGETGAGKTLVTEAISLLLGGRADPVLVRPGASEAEVEGRFVSDSGDEVVVRRVVPADGRSRAYVDGRLATAGALGEAVGDLVDIHGQHGNQALLRGPSRRGALDRFGSIDTAALAEVRVALSEARTKLESFGGDERVRAREIELLRFQIEEIEAAGILSADEDDDLHAEERLLSDASGHRESALGAASMLGADGVVGDGLARAAALLREREPFAAETSRIDSALAEITDMAAELRDRAEAIPDDPARLVAVGERRRVLAELRRKYGASLAEVVAFHVEASGRMTELDSFAESAAALQAEIEQLLGDEAREAAVLGAARRASAPDLAAEVQRRLRKLALPKAVLEVAVGEDPGDDVDFLVALNPGSPPLPLNKVASGGELSRIMLALQLVLASSPPTLIFDEVDAGVGGEAAAAIGRALAQVARRHQVLVVTHLPQVAAFADSQINISKSSTRGGVRTSLTLLDDAARIVELSRMLSGSPDSEAAREHAKELLAGARK